MKTHLKISTNGTKIVYTKVGKGFLIVSIHEKCIIPKINLIHNSFLILKSNLKL